MSFIIGLLTSRLVGPIAAGVAVLLALALVLNVVQLRGVRGDLKVALADAKAARADFATCKANTRALTSSLDTQNRAVDALKAESEVRVAASAKATSQARAVAESYRRSAADILKAKPASADRCEAAKLLIAETVR